MNSLENGLKRMSGVIEERFSPRPSPMSCSLDRRFDLGFSIGRPSLQLDRCGDSLLYQTGRRSLHRVLGNPSVKLCLAAITTASIVIHHRSDVLTPTIGHALEENWATASPGLLDPAQRRIIDRCYIVPVYPLAGDLECSHPLAQIRAFGLTDRQRAFGRIEVILAGEDDRQLADGGKVDCLVKRTFIQRSLAEEARSNVGFAIHGECESCTNRSGYGFRKDCRRHHKALVAGG